MKYMFILFSAIILRTIGVVSVDKLIYVQIIYLIIFSTLYTSFMSILPLYYNDLTILNTFCIIWFNVSKYTPCRLFDINSPLAIGHTTF